MRKKMMISSLVLAAFILFLPTTSILAASPDLDDDGLTTTGTVTFSQNPNKFGELVKPNENDPDGDKVEIIIMKDGNQGVGDLRIQFVPDFHFETITGFNLARQTAKAEVLSYKDKVGNETNKKVPPFVQVSNNTGLEGDGNHWALSVKASHFVGQHQRNILAEKHTLSAAHITLVGSTLTTTNGTNTLANTLVQKQDSEIIPIDGSSLTVLSSQDKTTTNGRQVSNVFHNNYKEAAVYPDGLTDGVVFVKPAGETTRKDYTYKATLSWTLTDGL